MIVSKLIKKIPKINNFIAYHNPNLKDLLKHSGICNVSKPIILDVGANKGQTIDFFNEKYPNSEIYSFEPTKDLALLLKEKYSNHNNINIYELALSDYSGKAEFFVSNFSATNSLLEPNTALYDKYNPNLSEKLKASKKESCKVDTLNNWYEKNLINQKIDLLKIDVQGAEYQVIKGGIEVIRNNVKAISIEMQYLPFYKECTPFYELMKLLYENNFFLYSLYGNSKKGFQMIESNALLLNQSLRKKIL